MKYSDQIHRTNIYLDKKYSEKTFLVVLGVNECKKPPVLSIVPKVLVHFISLYLNTE